MFERIAANMPLVTMISGEKFFSERFLPGNGQPSGNPPNLGIDWLGKSDGTRDTEEECGLDNPEPQRYFYAGRADPGFGGIAFAYDVGIDARAGDVTPFDTGLLWNKTIKSTAPNEDRVRALIRETASPLAEWRGPFEGFLAAFFSEPRDYFHGRPRADADWGPHDLPARHPGNTRFPTWTWEARTHEEHPLLNGLLFWAAPRETHKKLADYVSKQGASSSWREPSWVERLLEIEHIDFGPIKEIPSSERLPPDAFQAFENRIQQWLYF